MALSWDNAVETTRADAFATPVPPHTGELDFMLVPAPPQQASVAGEGNDLVSSKTLAPYLQGSLW